MLFQVLDDWHGKNDEKVRERGKVMPVAKGVSVNVRGKSKLSMGVREAMLGRREKVNRRRG